MQWPNKYRDLFAAASAELEATQNALQVERARRIAAETVAAERAQQLERAWEAARSAESARNEAVGERLKSLDLVNTTLLNAMGPEKAPPDIHQFKAIPKQKQHAVAVMRQADRRFYTSLVTGEFFKKKPAQPAKSEDTPIQ